MMAPRLWDLRRVEKNDQADLAFDLFGVIERLSSVAGGRRGGDGYDSLMIAGVGESVELAAVSKRTGMFARGRVARFLRRGCLGGPWRLGSVEGAADSRASRMA